METIENQARKNLLNLQNNVYPGRGIVVGLDESGEKLIQVYWIMGRGEDSRNRIFVEEANGVVKTAPADPAKMEGKDTSLILYTAMAQNSTLGIYAVSNGHQTEDALSMASLDKLDKKWRYEPDAPNNTPRITALMRLGVNNLNYVGISILKKSPFMEAGDAHIYRLSLFQGFGYCVHTYSGDGNPLPSFSGDPYALPLRGGIEEIAQEYWEVLDEANRVALVVKVIDIESHLDSIKIINKY